MVTIMLGVICIHGVSPVDISALWDQLPHSKLLMPHKWNLSWTEAMGAYYAKRDRPCYT